MLLKVALHILSLRDKDYYLMRIFYKYTVPAGQSRKIYFTFNATRFDMKPAEFMQPFQPTRITMDFLIMLRWPGELKNMHGVFLLTRQGINHH
jgi:hypothetical protein